LGQEGGINTEYSCDETYISTTLVWYESASHGGEGKQAHPGGIFEGWRGWGGSNSSIELPEVGIWGATLKLQSDFQYFMNQISGDT